MIGTLRAQPPFQLIYYKMPYQNSILFSYYLCMYRMGTLPFLVNQAISKSQTESGNIVKG